MGNEGQTHWEGCWKDPAHLECAVAHAARLETAIEDLRNVIGDRSVSEARVEDLGRVIAAGIASMRMAETRLTQERDEAKAPLESCQRARRAAEEEVSKLRGEMERLREEATDAHRAAPYLSRIGAQKNVIDALRTRAESAESRVSELEDALAEARGRKGENNER